MGSEESKMENSEQRSSTSSFDDNGNKNTHHQKITEDGVDMNIMEEGYSIELNHHGEGSDLLNASGDLNTMSSSPEDDEVGMEFSELGYELSKPQTKDTSSIISNVDYEISKPQSEEMKLIIFNNEFNSNTKPPQQSRTTAVVDKSSIVYDNVLTTHDSSSTSSTTTEEDIEEFKLNQFENPQFLPSFSKTEVKLKVGDINIPEEENQSKKIQSRIFTVYVNDSSNIIHSSIFPHIQNTNNITNENYDEFEDPFIDLFQPIQGKFIKGLKMEYPIRFLEIRFQRAWDNTSTYSRNKKGHAQTTIPLTSTSIFTRKLSFCSRFCRRLRSMSLCLCCCSKPEEDTGDPITRQESIEAFHNEIMSLKAEERPESLLPIPGRRRNITGATKSMKLVQKLHEHDNDKHRFSLTFRKTSQPK